ncbi:hypothetical protein AB4072_06455 [Microvirga sp. 2MCAF38]|uniref:hypothetical protein n=1 Tax=Microvirga sp. 2MCAF38 TaxID=3232989 RepID=UPI003F9CA275
MKTLTYALVAAALSGFLAASEAAAKKNEGLTVNGKSRDGLTLNGSSRDGLKITGL